KSPRPGQPLIPALRHGGRVTSVALSDDGRWLATGSTDGTTRLWDVKSGNRHGEPLQHVRPVTAVALSPDGQYLATIAGEPTRLNSVRLWSVATGKQADLPYALQSSVTSLAFIPSGKLAVTGGRKGVWIWDPDGDRPPVLREPRGLDEGITSYTLC